jgi:MFS superfamily sulfate permease-like transporter
MNYRTDDSKPALPTFGPSWRRDLTAGFLVFLIALPLCIGIALACGYPAVAGIFTAIIGGTLCTFLSNSELTIKGPAAGLIVIAVGAVIELGSGGAAHSLSELTPEQKFTGYQLALGVGVAAAVIQILFGLFKFGKYGDFFPLSAVHGVLAAIGIIIIAKQFPIALGVMDAKGDPLSLLGQIPEFFTRMNPEIALIGGLSLLILFGKPLIENRYVKRIPGPMLVVLIAVPLGMYFDLEHQHTYTFTSRRYKVGPDYEVKLISSLTAEMTAPVFTALATWAGWKYVLMFALVGSLESLLSAKAIDLIDPYRRKTDLNRDVLAIGVANACAAAVGGLPMISEIVRSKANIDNGARTRMADLFHGLFLLAFVALVPGLIHRIPLAALAAMLVYTGFRLASPGEFVGMYRVGPEQLVVFLSTIIATLATDLLIGIGVGIAVKFLFHLYNGLPLRAVFRPEADVERPNERTYVVVVRKAAVFSNWLGLKKVLDALEPDKDVVVDLSATRLVDHTVMEKLHDLEREYLEQGRRFVVTGLEGHNPLSSHPHAARKKKPQPGGNGAAAADLASQSNSGWSR